MKYPRVPRNDVDVCLVVAFEDATRRRFLMVRHRERGWELPGGRLAEGEAPLAAALREFAEETGRDLRDPRLVLERGAKAEGRTWVFEGMAGAVVHRIQGTEAALEAQFFEFLDDAPRLSFPDDDYTTLGTKLGRPLLREPRT